MAEEVADLAQRLSSGPPLISTELIPPDRADRASLLEAARAVKGAGAELLFIPDAPGGRAQVDSLTAAALVRGGTGLWCAPHLNCRDRNLLALEGALLSCELLGLDGIKAVTGDPVPSERGQGVYDVSSVDLVEMVRQRQESGLTVFVGHQVGHADPAPADDRLRGKLTAGAHAILTNPVLDPELLLKALDRLGTLSVPLLVGVVLIPSSELLDYLVAEVPTFRAPAGLSEELRKASSPQEAQEIGLRAALRVAMALRSRAAGFHVVGPFGRWEGALPLLEALGKTCR